MKQLLELKYTPNMIEEFRKCMNDPIHFINNYIFIYDPYNGKIKLTLLAYQEEMIKSYNESRILLLEADREMGKTTTALAFILWYSIFHNDKVIALMGHNYQYSKTFMRIIKDMYDDLPSWLRHSITEIRQDTIEFNNGCRILLRADSRSFKGMTLSLVYVDEMNLLPNRIQEDLVYGLFPCISSWSSKLIMSSKKSLSPCIFNTLIENAIEDDNSNLQVLRLHSK